MTRGGRPFLQGSLLIKGTANGRNTLLAVFHANGRGAFPKDDRDGGRAFTSSPWTQGKHSAGGGGGGGGAKAISVFFHGERRGGPL